MERRTAATRMTLGLRRMDGGTATDPDQVELDARLSDEARPDLFALELYKGSAEFSAAITIGTFTIAGANLNYETCGICARVFTDYDPATMLTAQQQYFATGGSATISSVRPNLTGYLSDLTFEEVTIDPVTFQSTPVPGGCTTAAMSGAFDVVKHLRVVAESIGERAASVTAACRYG